MRKHFLKILFVFIFLFSPLVVKADFGDLRYEITNVSINDSSITFKGWAFIHKTNNFNKVASNPTAEGGQKIRMRAMNGDETVLGEIAVDGSDDVNYNFYCELFYKGYADDDKDGEYTDLYDCTKDRYKNYEYNNCTGADDVHSQCYYEDLYFKITFNTSNWKVKETDEIKFQISATNEFYKNIKKCKDCYTAWEDVSIAAPAVSDSNGNYKKNDFIDTVENSVATSVEFIASSGILMSSIDTAANFVYSNGKSCSYGVWNSSVNSCGNVYLLLLDDDDYSDSYPYGRSKTRNNARCYSFLSTKDDTNNCVGTYNYLLKVKKDSSGVYKDKCDFACPVSATATDYTPAVARGSHVKPTGTFKITVKNDKKCEVTNPLPSELKCNDSGTLSSTCEQLTVHTGKGSAVVKIEQTGTVSSVLTPERIYNGGGFNFGIMYQNNIKWSYVGSVPGKELHGTINGEMNNKLKDYETYIASIDISNLNLVDKGDKKIGISSGMVKKCYSSSTSKDYYGDAGLTVTCVFTFPSSKISYDGTIKYNSVSEITSFGIDNKYYIPIDKRGDFDVTATITGMNRITESAATSDSKEEGKSWTGTWTDSIDGCIINVYPLISSEYKFIYRPIDINNPFPNRNAGFNWYDWIANSANRERLEKTYVNGSEYTATINNNFISKIKEYNKGHNYLDWSSINSGVSSFVDYYVKREGGS